MSPNEADGRRVEAAVARLRGHFAAEIDLGLDRMARLLAALGHPERRLPPVLHVAGTNGKGSTCAFLRAIAEVAGLRAHVYTSPHLVRFNERFRLAGRLVEDAALASALERVEAANAGLPLTGFEAITAAGLLLFAGEPADLCILEVGMGGRLDATNVVARPAACAIASISRDHAEYLGDDIAAIAREKAGIMRPGVPVVTGAQADPAARAIAGAAARCGAMLLARGRDWEIAPNAEGLRYRDAHGELALPLPGLAGAHQFDNAGIAVAALRAARGRPGPVVPEAAYRGIADARWPARLQRLPRLAAAFLPAGWEIWLDGGHNEEAGRALAAHAAPWRDRRLHLVAGLKRGKEAGAFLRPLLPLAETAWAVAEPGQFEALPAAEVAAAAAGRMRVGPTVRDALAGLRERPPGRVLVCGSLYLAGEVLKLEDAA